MYASFGSQVTLVEAEPRLLPGEPAFAGEILAVALRRAGAEIRLGSRATKAERTADGLTLALEDGTRIDAARLLLASGRRPRLGGLGLDVLGLELTPGMALPTTTRCEVAGTGGLASGSGPPGTSPAPRTPTPATTRPTWSRRTSSAGTARRTTARSRGACSPRPRCSRSAPSRAQPRAGRLPPTTASPDHRPDPAQTPARITGPGTGRRCDACCGSHGCRRRRHRLRAGRQRLRAAPGLGAAPYLRVAPCLRAARAPG